ncbi:DNA-methyltransferase [Yersinia enterocolitica]
MFVGNSTLQLPSGKLKHIKVRQIGNATLYCGNALEILPFIKSGSVDALITDPPYSSGATHKSGRTTTPPTSKYLNEENKRFEEFDGENMDARSWAFWCSLWMSHACKAVIPSKKLHPTAKPEELMAELVKTANTNGIILDPFMGSGTTGVAALKAGCQFIGIESSEHYFEVATQRLQSTLRP